MTVACKKYYSFELSYFVNNCAILFNLTTVILSMYHDNRIRQHSIISDFRNFLYKSACKIYFNRHLNYSDLYIEYFNTIITTSIVLIFTYLFIYINIFSYNILIIFFTYNIVSYNILYLFLLIFFLVTFLLYSSLIYINIFSYNIFIILFLIILL